MLDENVIGRIDSIGRALTEQIKAQERHETENDHRNDQNRKDVRHEPPTNRRELRCLTHEGFTHVGLVVRHEALALAYLFEETPVGAGQLGCVHFRLCLQIIRIGHGWRLPVVSSVLTYDTSDNRGGVL